MPVAVMMGDLAAVEGHIAAGTDLNRHDAYGSTPLMIAAVFDKPDVAAALLAAGGDPADQFRLGAWRPVLRAGA